MAAPRGGMVRLVPERGSDLTLILNKEPDRSGGVGGWQPTERSQRRPAKWWKNIPDDTISFDCTLDIDAIGGPSIERRLRVLRDMGQPSDDGDDPPSIRLLGDVWDEDKNVDWVMSNWALGPRLWLGDGSLRRQQVQVDLERFTDLAEISAIRVHSTRTKNRRRRRTVVTRAHDTLRSVALREMGDSTRWKDLQRWNAKLKRTDPDIALRAGTHVAIKG